MNSKDKKNLFELIKHLPTADINNSDLKELVLQFIVEVPHDDPNSKFAAKSQCKLSALKLLSDIIRNEDMGSYEEELLEQAMMEQAMSARLGSLGQQQIGVEGGFAYGAGQTALADAQRRILANQIRDAF